MISVIWEQCPGLELTTENFQCSIMSIMGSLNWAVKEIQLSRYNLPTSRCVYMQIPKFHSQPELVSWGHYNNSQPPSWVTYNRHLLFYISRGQKSAIKVLAGPRFLGSFQEESVSALPSTQWIQVFFTCGCLALISAKVFTRLSSVCLCVSSSSIREKSHWMEGPC